MVTELVSDIARARIRARGAVDRCGVAVRDLSVREVRLRTCGVGLMLASGERGESLPAVTVLSFRLGGADGVSVAAAQWVTALGRMGCRVRTVAGSGSADRLGPGLRSGATR